MAVAGKLDRLSQKITAIRNCLPLLRVLGNPSLETAGKWLEKLGASTDTVWYKNQWIQIHRLIEEERETRYAFLVPICFIGGPPGLISDDEGVGYVGTYRGSLYTFLLDRILYYIEKVGLDAVENVLGLRHTV